MLDQAGAVFTSTNPGVILIIAAVVAVVVRGMAARVVVLVGAPLLALGSLLYARDFGTDLAGLGFLDFHLAPYRLDRISRIFGFGFLIASALSGIYSLWREDRLQDAAGLAYAGAATGAVFAGDFLSLIVFWELAALTSVALILARRTREAQKAALRYFVVQTISGLVLIAGAAQYGTSVGTFVFSEMMPPGELLVGMFDIHRPGALLILIAAGIKAGFPLMHNQMTDSYPHTTETGAVALAGLSPTIGVYLLMRGFAGLDALVWIGAAMTVYPVFFAVLENDLRKVLAYSTNNQIGFMVCAVGIGGPLAINGAAAHAVAHMLFKGLLFMSMGAVMLRAGTTKASELGGLHRSMPFTTLFCLAGALSIAGFPFFAAFATKSMIMTSAHLTPGLYVAWLMLLFASAGVLEHSGIKVPYFAFFSHDNGMRVKEAPFAMLLAMGIATALCVLIGLNPRWFYELLPYRDEASVFLTRQLWTPAHMLEQASLLAFALLAFLVLKWTRTYPTERNGVIIDVEWLWRAGAPRLGRALGGRLNMLGEAIAGGAAALVTGILFGARQAFAPDGALSRRFPLANTAVWTACILAVVLVFSLVSSR
jgi:multicomponent Na+:H+ antiporter subunit D